MAMDAPAFVPGGHLGQEMRGLEAEGLVEFHDGMGHAAQFSFSRRPGPLGTAEGFL
jgi:hypothetical protein